MSRQDVCQGAGKFPPPLEERDELRGRLLLGGFFDVGGGCFHDSVSCLGAVVGSASVLPPARSNTSLSACTSLCPALTMRARASACSQSVAGGGSTPNGCCSSCTIALRIIRSALPSSAASFEVMSFSSSMLQTSRRCMSQRSR